MAEAAREEQVGSAMIHGKPIEVTEVPHPLRPDGPGEIVVKVDGEVLPNQQRVIVDSGMEETTIEVELVHLPTLGTIHLSGYLIDEADWKLLQRAKKEGVDERG